MQIKIRSASMDDAPVLSGLSGELGYSVSKADMRKRLENMLKSADHAIYVAVLLKEKTVGWIHVYESKRLESGSFAEIGGFVVSESFRRKGIGRSLLKTAEAWTIQNKLRKLRVRSHINRKDAKKFYSNMGFSISKQQTVFDKTPIKE